MAPKSASRPNASTLNEILDCVTTNAPDRLYPHPYDPHVEYYVSE